MLQRCKQVEQRGTDVNSLRLFRGSNILPTHRRVLHIEDRLSIGTILRSQQMSPSMTPSSSVTSVFLDRQGRRKRVALSCCRASEGPSAIVLIEYNKSQESRGGDRVGISANRPGSACLLSVPTRLATRGVALPVNGKVPGQQSSTNTV